VSFEFLVITQNSTLKTMSAHTDRPASVPYSRVPAFGLIDSQLRRVKGLINEQLTSPAEADDVNRLLKHVRGHSGKMIRPGLVLLAGGCCGEITDEHIRVAAIVEMIHGATLLHDDVIDEGQKRRGLATINALWGNEAAVLLGDFLLGRVFEMCAELGPRIAKIIANVAVRVCEGELRQIIQRRNWELSESEYIDVITEKSAVLFSSSCHLGALSARATETQARSLAEFGMNAGIAFQIADDLLDIVGDESKTGKTLGRDADKHKLTLAVIHLLGAVGEREKEAVISSYLERKQYDKDALTEMLGRYGSLEYTHSRAQEYVTRAVGALGGLKESAAKDALVETAKFITSRVV
jgi:octaprenyl-diphosphate synthase